MKLFRLLVPFALLLALIPGIAPTAAHAEVDIYTTPGPHHVNGRDWRTVCEPYSQTKRCTTEIWATQVTQSADGKFLQANGWVFNNLTYAASSRTMWKG